MPFRDGFRAETGSRPQMIRARSCWCSGTRLWIRGTVSTHTRRKERKAIGQLFSDKSVIMPETPALLLRLGRGTDGGLVVHLRAAKYRQSAGPGENFRFGKHWSKPRFVRLGGTHTCYHKVPFCAAEQLSVDQPLDLGLGEGRLEI